MPPQKPHAPLPACCCKMCEPTCSRILSALTFVLHTRHCCWPGAANGGDGAGGAAGAAGGDGGGPALVLACNCMEDAAGAAHVWKKPFKLCWPCSA